MRVIHGIEAARLSGVVLTIGNFDGVHRGHQALLNKALELARTEATLKAILETAPAGAQVAVMTFDPHPSAILNPDRVPPTLTPMHERLRLLARAGVDVAVVVRSRPEFFHMSAEDFIRDVIVGRFHPVAMVEGHDFRFGRHRQGDVRMLRDAGAQHGFAIHTVEPVRAALGGHPDTVISSSLVRHLLSSGNVDRAALCLGRPYALFGTVRSGAGRGRTLGFPTANLAPESQLIPAEGVYAGLTRVLDGGSYEGERGRGGEQEGSGFRVQGSGEAGMAGQGGKATEGQRDGGTRGHGDTGTWRQVDTETRGQGEGKEARCGDTGAEEHQAGAPIPAAISIGRTPTFSGSEVLIEAHLLDFSGDLYGRHLQLEFLDWIRGQQRFASIDELKVQIGRDIAQVRTTTSEPRPSFEI